MNVRLIAVGNLKEKYLIDAFCEYEKRISQYAKVEIIELREERIQNEDDEEEIARALSTEGEHILSKIPKDSYSVALCVEGREVDSCGLSKIIEAAKDGTGKITFVIGSSHGLCDKVKSACNQKLSFSRLTFPHQLMRVILAEAVYRSFTIMAGKRYHK